MAQSSLKASVVDAVHRRDVTWSSINQPNEICSQVSEKASNCRFLKTDKLQNRFNEGTGKEKKKERGEEKKSNGCTLSFYKREVNI